MHAKQNRGMIIGLTRMASGLLPSLILVLTLLCAGCGGQGGVAGAQAQPVGEVLAWPAFPGDSTPGSHPVYRVTSGTVSIYGTEFDSQVGLYNRADNLVPNAYVIIPGGGNWHFAYAWYAMRGLDMQRPVSMDLSVTAAPFLPGGANNLPLSYYVGVSDYTTFSWQWFGPYTDAHVSIALNDQPTNRLDRYISSDASGNALQVVIATAAGKEFSTEHNAIGLTAARIQALSVNTLRANNPNYSTTRPHYTPIETIGAPSGKGPSMLDPRLYVQLTWTHLAETYGANLAASSYDVYRKGPDDQQAIPIGSVAAPTQTYTDPTDNAPGVLEPVAGASYTYYLRAVNAAGCTPFDQKSYTIPANLSVVITGYDIRAAGATGGSGASSDIFNGELATVVANQALSMALNSVSGTWNGEAYNATAFPGSMTQADYDTIKAAVTAVLQWEFLNQDGAPAGFTTPWFVPTAAYGGVGDPGAGTVCPDNYFGAGAMDPEGVCSTTLPAGAISSGNPYIDIAVPDAVSGYFSFDLTADPVAPMIEGFYNEPACTSRLTHLETGAGVTTIYFKMDSWGATGAALPADGANCKLQLIQITRNDPPYAPLDLTWYTGTGNDPGAGEFYFYHAPDPLNIDIFIGKVPGTTLVYGACYSIRFYDGATWSTIYHPSNY
jgi:hypothetical protein